MTQSNQTSCHLVEAPVAAADHGAAPDWAQPVATAPGGRNPSRMRTACQRGMVTAEYAVGILAAIALAMVLVNVIEHGTFKAEMLRQVTKLIGQIGAQIK